MQRVSNHPRIIHFYGVCKHKDTICIITEYMAHGSLWDCLFNKTKKSKLLHILTVETRLKMAREAAEGISFLHKQSIIHRDISARNFLVDSYFHVKIADLGMARLKSSKFLKASSSHNENSVFKYKNSEKYIKNDKNVNENENDNKMQEMDNYIEHHENEYKQHDHDVTNNRFGPIRWMAPECIYSQGGLEYSEKTDSYAFGMTLYEIFAEKKPFHNIKALARVADDVYNGKRPDIDDEYGIQIVGRKLGQLLKECWEHNPRQRPTFDIIMGDLRNISDEYGQRWKNNAAFRESIAHKFKYVD